MNNNQNTMFIVEYSTDTIEGKGYDVIAAITTVLEDAKRIDEALPKVMGVSPTASIYEYDIDTYESFYKKNSYRSKYNKEYRLQCDGRWLLFS